MVSRFKRIVRRPSDPAPDPRGPGRERIDPEALLPQIRAGLSAIEKTRAELSLREQALLAEASALYEQLKLTAQALADVRRQQAATSEHEQKIQTAAHLLGHQHSGQPDIDRGDPARPDVLVVQPQD